MAERVEDIIVMFPFMAQGHIIPFIALALQLEQRGFNIILVNTPHNIQTIRQSIPPTSAIRLREIPFNSFDHGLPPAAENTDVLPPNLIFNLIQSSISLKPAFSDLISDLQRGGIPPLAVVSDIFFGWSADVAHEFGVFHVIFSGAGGFGLACYYSIWMNLPHRNSVLPELVLSDFPESGHLHRTQLPSNMLEANDIDQETIFRRESLTSWSNTDGFLFNSVEELDKIGLNYFRRTLGRKVWPVGPIIPPGVNPVRAWKKTGISPGTCIKWLDSKPPNSVLFISFGSNNTISSSQMMQLARALEQAINICFIWVVRPPLGFDINSKFRVEDWLPDGFIHRVVETRNRGLIIAQWAPQLEILSHNSVGAFLTHCGWNSVLESLSRGVPLMAWPMEAEQFFNAKFLEEEIGICVEVVRGANVEIRWEDLMEKIEVVMEESEKGKEMKRKAAEVKKKMKNAVEDEGEGFKGSSVLAMDEFLAAAFLWKEKMGIGIMPNGFL